MKIRDQAARLKKLETQKLQESKSKTIVEEDIDFPPSSQINQGDLRKYYDQLLYSYNVVRKDNEELARAYNKKDEKLKEISNRTKESGVLSRRECDIIDNLFQKHRLNYSSENPRIEFLLDLSNILEENDELRRQVVKYNSLIEELTQRNDDLERSHLSISQNKEKVRNDVSSGLKDLQRAEAAVLKLERENGLLKKENKKLKSDNLDNKSQEHQILLREYETIIELNTQLEQENKELLKKNMKAINRLSSAERAIADLERDNRQMAEVLEDNESLLKDQLKSVNDLRGSSLTFKEETGKLEETKRSLEDRIKKLKDKVQELDSKLESKSKETEDLRKESNRLEEEVKNLKADVGIKQKAIDDFEEQMARGDATTRDKDRLLRKVVETIDNNIVYFNCSITDNIECKIANLELTLGELVGDNKDLVRDYKIKTAFLNN